MNKFTKDLAVEAGFKIFGDKIVAADNGSSGLATVCLEKYTKLIIEECIKICSERGEAAKFSYTPAKALAALMSAEGCAKLIENRFGE